MSKLTLLDVSNISGEENTAIVTINANSDAIVSALDNTLSLDGSSPNAMNADLDLNGNDILNAATVDTGILFINGVQVSTDLDAVGPQGDNGWSPVFAIVTDSARRVLQLKDYVGGTGDKPTDNINYYVGSTGMTATLANGVDIRGAQGAAGAGSGDMVAATYDAANIAQQVVGTTATQTLTNKTLTSPVVNSMTGSVASSVTATTQTAGDATTKIATTAFVTDALTKLTGLNTQTGTTYTLVLGDAGKLIEMNNASTNTLTVPPNSSVAFPLNTRIDIIQYGAGQTSIAAGAGVTINKTPGLKLSARYAAATLFKRATDEWHLMGNLSS